MSLLPPDFYFDKEDTVNHKEDRWIEKGRKGLSVQNCKVRGTHIGVEDHGCFTINVDFGGSGWGQGTGHRIFGGPHATNPWFSPLLGEYLYTLISVVGAETWEEMGKKHCRIARKDEYGDILGVGHLIDDRWFFFDSLKKEST